MKTRRHLFYLIASLCIALPHGAAFADQTVHFETAAESGGTAAQTPAVPLLGYLTLPAGNGPFPAIVLMHGCGGINTSVRDDWPERLASWGYAALVVDSFTTRDVKNTCHGGSSFDRVDDAYGALDFLATQNAVDPGRIVLMGFSAGGITTLKAARLGGVERRMDRAFKAAIAYYPICGRKGDMAIPTQILVGALDDWSPAARCEQMVADRTGAGSPVELHVYPGAYHEFDNAEFTKPRTTLGHRIEYNAAAAGQSIDAVHAFLRAEFGG